LIFCFMKKHILILSLFSLCILEACGPEKPTKAVETEKKIAQLKSPQNNQIVKRGEAIDIALNLKEGAADMVDSIVVYINDKRTTIIDKAKPELHLPMEKVNLGRAKMIVMVFKNDGSQENKLAMLKILSGIIPKNYGYKVLKSYPHNKTSYTQGLIWHNGFLYESTGQRGFSKLLKVNLETGKAEKEFDLDDSFFGEGLTLWQDKLIQITWTSQTGFVYDLETFTLKNHFNYAGEGWGITHNGEHLIMSNGSNEIAFLNPDNFKVVKTINVMDDKGQVDKLNELEYINGEIWSSYYAYEVYKIVRINPETGEVIGYVDLSGILAETDKHLDIDVLNGIAYDAENERLFVTGKNYPKLYEIEVFEK